MLDAGQDAPDFSGETQHGDTVALNEFQEDTVAVYFYPKDDTPGCTKEACSLRDGYEQLQAAGVQVIGVSADDAASHDAFADKYDLPFPLIADPEHEIIDKYGVRGRFGNAKRVTFIIEYRVIQDVITDVDTDHHAEQVLNALDD